MGLTKLEQGVIAGLLLGILVGMIIQKKTNFLKDSK